MNPIKQYNVHICQFPGNNMTHPDVNIFLALTHHKMKTDKRIGNVTWFAKSDTPITMVRNQAVYEGLRFGADYILMIDSDMGPDYLVGKDPNARPFWDVAWEFMMARASLPEKLPPATIAAPYCGPPPKEMPYIFRWKNWQSDCPDANFRLEMLTREDAAMRGGIEAVAALPTGLILYDARVFRELEAAGALPWFDYEYTDKYCREKSTTEDVFQTRNGSLLNMPLYAAWDCWAQHHKYKAVGKPEPVTLEQVQGHMRKALASKYESPESRVVMVNQYDPKHAPKEEVVGDSVRICPATSHRCTMLPECTAGVCMYEALAFRQPSVSGMGRPDHSSDAGSGQARECPPLPGEVKARPRIWRTEDFGK